MDRILYGFFALLLSISSFLQTARTGERKPVFSDPQPPAQKAAVQTPSFRMGTYDLVVSPDGDDAADGTPEHPLRTIEEAKTRMAATREQTAQHGAFVWLRGGVYTLSDTLRFGAQDAQNVTYCAYPGEKVMLCGGQVLCGGWMEMTVNGVRAWTRTVDEPFAALYRMDGQAVRRTRYPQTGYFTVRDRCPEGALYTEENTPWEYMLGECAFTADPEELRALSSFRNSSDILVRLLHYWKDEMLPVSSYDPETGVLRSTKYCSMSPKPGDRYYLENVFEALDAPGEWYLDCKANQLYYIPLPDDNMESTLLYTGKLEKLIEIENAKSINFTGVTFCNTGWHPLQPEECTDFHPGLEHPQAAYSTPACVTASHVRDVRFDACTFVNIGITALRFLTDAQCCGVTRCLFQNIGGNAVYISGPNADCAQTTQDIEVSDNHILQYGRNWLNAIGVLATHARRVTIAHNEIHDGYYTAVSVGWVWGYDENITDDNHIEYNRIYDIGQGWLSDMGGVYTLGMQPHTVIRGNVISNVAADPGENGYGGWGVYLDEGSSGILVEQNLVYDCGSQGFHQHYGRENILRNNIFAMNRMGQLRITRKESHISCIMENNIICGADTAMFTQVHGQQVKERNNLYFDTQRGRFVRSITSTDAQGRIPLHCVCSVTDMRLRGYYSDAVFWDPWFRDAAAFDFTLADNSCVTTLGFAPWSYAQAGTLSQIGTL